MADRARSPEAKLRRKQKDAIRFKANAAALTFQHQGWRSQNREREAATNRERRRRHPKANAWSYYRTGAKARGLLFLVSREDFYRLLEQACVYCGRVPEPINGLDRIDNSKGYTSDNVAPCCRVCNKAKSDMTRDQFLDWAQRLVDFQTSLRKAG